MDIRWLSGWMFWMAGCIPSIFFSFRYAKIWKCIALSSFQWFSRQRHHRTANEEQRRLFRHVIILWFVSRLSIPILNNAKIVYSEESSLGVNDEVRTIFQVNFHVLSGLIVLSLFIRMNDATMFDICARSVMLLQMESKRFFYYFEQQKTERMPTVTWSV